MNSERIRPYGMGEVLESQVKPLSLWAERVGLIPDCPHSRTLTECA